MKLCLGGGPYPCWGQNTPSDIESQGFWEPLNRKNRQIGTGSSEKGIRVLTGILKRVHIALVDIS